MSSGDNGGSGGVEFQKRNSWVIPLEVLAIIGGIGLVVLWFLAGPSFSELSGERPSPTASTDPVDMSINGVALRIPSNFMPLGRNRSGGEQDDVRLEALLPAMTGFSTADAGAFSLNAPDSRVVQLILAPNKSALSERDLFERVLKTLTANPEGEPGPNGLTRYTFPEQSDKADTEMFTFSAGEGALLLLQCEKATDGSQRGGSCQRVTRTSDNLSLTYRFKRAHLDQWPAIDQGVMRLIQGFRSAASS